MNSPIPNPVGRVLRRRLIDKALVREDIRKLGLVLVGAGLLAIGFDANPTGVASIVIGAVLLYAGHIEAQK